VILRALVHLDSRDAELLKARLCGERTGRMECVALGGRPSVIVWVNVDDLALALFATWPSSRPLARAVVKFHEAIYRKATR
jgi:hypothetical protein